MEKTSKIYVAGHTGLVGSAIVRALRKEGYYNLITYPHKNCDLVDPNVSKWIFSTDKPEYVFLAAAKVGGINANMTYPGDFVRENLLIQTNVIEAARLSGVEKLIFLGSACIYPKVCKQPIREEYLLTDSLEPSNIGYAITKIAGLITCDSYRKQYGCNFISAMPTNLYGIRDNFHLSDCHVLPAMIRKFYEATLANIKNVILWGTGNVRREFLYADDLAEALIFLMNNYSQAGHINIGTGQDVSIKELAKIISSIVGYKGSIHWNTDMPDGTPVRILDVEKINKLGWKSSTSLEDGIQKAYKWFVDNYKNARK